MKPGVRTLLAGLALAGLALATGCATLGGRPGGLTVRVDPEVIHPGDVVTVLVEAPAGTRNMTGRLALAGSPQVPLRSSDNGRTWRFRTQVPLDAVWEPGRYRVEINAQGPDGSPLSGDAWVTAP